MATPFVLGAYASLPAPELEADYYQLLAAQPWVSGVEIPYPGQLATQAPLLASRLAEHWNFNTITAIPGTMQHVWKDANFGLASPDDAGRQGALEFTRCTATWVSYVRFLAAPWWRECSYTRLLLVWLMAMLLSVHLSSCWVGTGLAPNW